MTPEILVDQERQNQFQPNSHSEPKILGVIVPRTSFLRDAREEIAWARKIEEDVVALFEVHPHFRGRSLYFECHYSNGCLLLTGRLPSFYLKQLAQEALRCLPDVDQIENQIVVASPTGQMASNQQMHPAISTRK